MDCNQSLQCGNPDPLTLGIYTFLMILHLALIISLTVNFLAGCMNRKARSLRLVLQYVNSMLYVVLKMTYFLGVAFKYSFEFYSLIQNLGNVFYISALLFYLSNWLHLLIQVTQQNPRLQKNKVKVLNISFIAATLTLYILQVLVIAISPSDQWIKSYYYFHAVIYVIMAISYSIICYKILKILKLYHFVLYRYYYKTILVTTLIEAIALLGRAFYIQLMLIILNLSQEQTRFPQLPYTALFIVFPLYISSQISVGIAQISPQQVNLIFEEEQEQIQNKSSTINEVSNLNLLPNDKNQIS